MQDKRQLGTYTICRSLMVGDLGGEDMMKKERN